MQFLVRISDKTSGQFGECGVSRIFPVTLHSPKRQTLSSYTNQFEQKCREVVWGSVFFKTRCQRAVNRYEHRPSTATTCKIQGNWLPQDIRLKIEPAWSAVQCSSSRKSDVIASSACWVICSQGIFLKHFTFPSGKSLFYTIRLEQKYREVVTNKIAPSAGWVMCSKWNFLWIVQLLCQTVGKKKLWEKKSVTRNEKSVDYLLLITSHNPCVRSFPDLPTDDVVVRRNILMSLPTVPADLYYRSRNRMYCVVSIVCCVYHVCRK